MDHTSVNHVLCICGGDGFPLGSGTAVRIGLVGRALQSAGISFHLLHCGPSPNPLNKNRYGSHEGISYEYTSPLKRPANAVLRSLVYAIGVAGATRRLIGLRFSRVPSGVYLYVMFGPLNLYFGWLCRILGLPLIQELCEWWPGEPSCTAFSKWLYKKTIFANAIGVLAITDTIEARVKKLAATANPQLKIHLLPSLIDLKKFGTPSGSSVRSLGDAPAFLWCGTLDGWRRDVLFLVQALSLVQQRGYRCRLFVVGSFREETREQVMRYAAEQGVPSDSIVLTGWMEDGWLSNAYREAQALLLPLWDDDRSRSRMPNKLAEYLAAARPVITAGVGSIGEVLTDSVNACLVTPGNASEFAEAMIRVLDQPEWAAKIGAHGREICLSRFDYRAQAEDLGAFCRSCIDGPVPMIEGDEAQRNQHTVRNYLCGLFALGLIAVGAVRRARAEAFREGTVTAVYFHKPSRQLFEKCIRWFRKNGYVFISERDLISFLRGGRTLPKGSVWLSFDDGAAELVREILPVITRENLPVTLFIPTDIVATDGRFPWIHGALNRNAGSDPRHAMSIDDLIAASKNPEVAIGSHTATHAVLPWCRSIDLEREILRSKVLLETILGQEVSTFSYPNGQTDSRSERLLASSGYSMAVTTENRFIKAGDNSLHIPRFSVGDSLFFPEAICNLVGAWRPSIDFIKSAFRGRWAKSRTAPERLATHP